MLDARTAVAFDGSALRYAEVAPAAADGRPRLLRLGTATFPFDTRRAFEGDAAALAALGAAVTDVLGGVLPDAVVLGPTGLAAWAAPFAPDTPDDARADRLRREAALLTGLDPADLHLVTAPLAAPDGRSWTHVVALPAAHARALAYLGDGTPPDLVLAPYAAARTVPARGATLVVGVAPDAAAFALAVDGHVRLVGGVPADDPSDAAFAALRLVQQAGAGRMPHALGLYGADVPDAALAAFAGAFGVEAKRLRPLDGLDLPAPLPAGFAAEAFAPVVGAALGPPPDGGAP